MADKVCKKRWCCASPFFALLEKPEWGSHHHNPIRARVKTEVIIGEKGHSWAKNDMFFKKISDISKSILARGNPNRASEGY